MWDGGESRPYKVIPNSIRYEIEKVCRKFIWGEKEGKDKINPSYQMEIYWAVL